MNHLLEVDEARTADAVAEHIRSAVESRSLEGVYLGLSGGIDSAVLAALAVRALGAERVHAIYFYDHLNSKVLARRSRLVADLLAIDLQIRPIEADLRARGVYRSPLIRLANFSALQNRIWLRFSNFVLGETGYLDELRSGNPDSPRAGVFKRRFQRMSRGTRHDIFAKHRYRCELAAAEARRRRLQLLDAGNRTEWLIGHLADSVDDLELQPIGGLYKTQVRQLAAFLGLPDEVRLQPPSPDIARGITDELDLGISYAKIDLALDHLAGGLALDAIRSAGCSDAEVAYVGKLHDLSGFRRAGKPDPYAVDAGPGSIFRK